MVIQVTPEVQEDFVTIKKSGLFDEIWYLKTYSDVAKLNFDPIVHYVMWGAKESRNPTLAFSTAMYIRNVDPKLIGTRNPFAYFIKNGNPLQLIDRGLLTKLSASLIHRGIELLLKLPIFDPQEYANMNDVGELVPANHALAVGCLQGKEIFSKVKVAQAFRDIIAVPFTKDVNQQAEVIPLSRPFELIYNEDGDARFKKLAFDLAEALTKAGQKAGLIGSKSFRSSNNSNKIIVAPHEFFFVGNRGEAISGGTISNSIMLNTEQPPTVSFSKALPYVLMSNGVIDTSYHVAQLFKQAGLPAGFFDPIAASKFGYLRPKIDAHPLVSALPKLAQDPGSQTTPFMKRPIAISFFGKTSPYRNKFFARNARFFSAYECFFYYRGTPRPAALNGYDGTVEELASYVATQTKIWLYIASFDNEMLSWHRIQQGLVGGCVVVTEPTLPHPFLKQGVHYLEESGRHLSNLIEWLLETEDGRAKARVVQENVALLLKDRTEPMISSELLYFLADVCEEST